MSNSFPFFFPSRFDMAGNPSQLVAEELDMSWIGEEPLSTPTIYAFVDPTEDPFSNVDPRGGEGWEVCLHTVGSRICSLYMESMIPIYEVVFKNMGFRLPFFGFQNEIFKSLELALYKIHLNSFGFIRAFELVCEYLELTPTIHMFFSIFSLQRGAEK